MRLTPNGHFWLFYLPLLILLGIITLPIYAAEVDTQIIPYVAPVFSISLAALFLTSGLLGFLASSNEASEDFQVPLFREAVWLARIQSTLPGVTSVRIVVDKAEVGEYRVYDNPRTFIRLEELDSSAYIETWTRELRAIESILCKYQVSDTTPQVVWWWVAQDRIFRKYVGDDKEGYYVKFPVKSNEYGVKDVEILSKNAIAIVYRESLKNKGDNSTIVEILKALNALLE
jgi:hypothetical protein